MGRIETRRLLCLIPLARLCRLGPPRTGGRPSGCSHPAFHGFYPLLANPCLCANERGARYRFRAQYRFGASVSNARIFQAQCRRLSLHLQSDFRLVFAQAPFPSNAGSDVLSVYSTWGPFKRWLRWQPEHPDIPAEVIVREIDRSLDDTMRQDDLCGATGPWVVILGFSQCAKVAASLLYRQQVRESLFGTLGGTGPRFRFAVLLAGRAPLISLDSGLALHPPLPDAAQITDTPLPRPGPTQAGGHILRIPTIHVHGLRDKELHLHRKLSNECCEPTTRIIMEWDGDHRVPLKALDVSQIASLIRELAQETRVL